MTNRCLYCGIEIESGIFCQEHNIERNIDLYTVFKKVSALEIKGWQYDFFDKFFNIEEGYRTFLVKAPRGAYKSTTADMIVALLCGLYTDIEILIASISFPVSLQHIRNIKGMIKSSDMFSELSYKELFVEDSKQQFELTNGVRVFAIPQSDKTQTGYHPDMKIVDELARMRPDFYFNSIFPMGRGKSLDTKIQEIIVSTGFGSSGAFADILRGRDPSVYKMDVSIDQCYWLKDRLEIERMRMPEHLFRQEMLGELIDDIDTVFSTEAILSSIISEPQLSKSYVMGIDLGRKVDYTAVIIVDILYNNVVYVERFEDPIYRSSWEAQFRRIRQLVNEWRPKDIFIDATGIGDVISQELSDLNPIEVVITSKLKEELISKLQLCFEANLHGNNGLKIPSKFELLIEELQAFEYKSGSLQKTGAPIGMHDDLVMALALCVDDISVDGMVSERSDGYGFAFGSSIY